MHESHYRGTVTKMRDIARTEEMKYKGEVMIVIGSTAGEIGLEANENEDEVRVNVEDLCKILSSNVKLRHRDLKLVIN